MSGGQKKGFFFHVLEGGEKEVFGNKFYEVLTSVQSEKKCEV